MALSPAARVVSAGAASVAVSFGLARYGYGLLLPDLRAALDLDSAALGLIGSGSFAAYLLATVAAGDLAARVGARGLVVAGGALAVAGMLVVAAARSAPALGAGILVAGAASGLVFPPFADAVEQRVAPQGRARSLAVISSGTGWGVLVSVPIALVAGASWRVRGSPSPCWPGSRPRGRRSPCAASWPPARTSTGCARAGSSARDRARCWPARC